MTYDGPEPERVRRAIVALAQGDSTELRILLRAAETDYRDVLWWEQREKEGLPDDEIDIELLTARLKPQARPEPSGVSSGVSIVLLDAGPPTEGLVKALRRISGLGLGVVSTLGDRVPVTIAEALDREEAEELRAQLHALGAWVELR